MIKDLINAIKTTLEVQYPTFNIYTDAGSTIEEPAFIINVVDYKKQTEIGRGLITVSFEIICRVDTGISQFTYHDIALVLDEKLELIVVNNDYFHQTNQTVQFGSELNYKFAFVIPYLTTDNEIDTKISNLKNSITVVE